MKMLFAILTLATIGFAQTSQHAAPSVSQLLGTWRLISIEVTMKDGSVQPDPMFGPKPVGYLMYEPDGHMCAEIMKPDRPAGQNPHQPTTEDKVIAFDGFLAYCGTFKLDAQKSIVTHYPDVAWTPSYVGSTQPRPFHIEGDRLIITPSNDHPPVTGWVLTWERAH